MRKYFLALLAAAATAVGQPSLTNLSTVWVSGFDIFPYSLAVDSDGGVYILAGANEGFVPTNPVYGPGGRATAILKLNPQGNLLWSTAIDSGSGVALAVDAAENVYIAGRADGNSFPTTPAAFQRSLNSTDVTYVVKLNASGLVEWATLLGGQGTTSVPSTIAVDATGVIVAGYAAGPSFPTTPGAFQQTPKGGSINEGFITKLNLTGSALLFSTLLGGSGSDNIDRIAIDNQGALYALGRSSSLDFPVTPGAYKSSGCVFLAKLNPAGSSLVFSTFVSGTQSNTCLLRGVLSIDSGGNSYIEASPHILKINSTGTGLVYDRTLNGNLGAGLFDLVADSSGNVFVAGSTLSSDFPIAAPCFRSVAGVPTAFTDFILRLDASGGIADGGYLPLPANSNGNGRVLKMDSGGNFYTVYNAPIGVRKFTPGAGSPAALRCVANSGHFGKAPVAPGEIVSLFGDGIGPDQAANLALDASGKVANVLANTQAFFDGIPSPLLYAQSRQINAVVPWELQGRKTTEVCVVYVGAKTNCIPLPVSEMSPGFFRIRPGYLAALNEDSTINAPDNPAKKGSIVTLFLTGSGPSVPPQADGEVTQGAPPSADAVKMSFTIFSKGFPIEVPLEVVWHSAAPALVSGVEVIQIRIPIGYIFQDVSLTMQSSTGTVFQDGGSIYVAPQ